MAVTTEGAFLTEQHRRAQQTIVLRVLRALIELWRTGFSSEAVDAFWPGLRAAVTSEISVARPQSVAVAADYYRAFRAAEGVAGEAPVRLAEPLNADLVRATLDINGAVSFKQSITRGNTPEQAQHRALVTVSGAAQKLVLDGGRTTVEQTKDDDKLALGWARVTDSDPCAFCAMLASRGPVFRTARSAGDPRAGGMPFHNGDQCTVEPVFHEDAEWPGRAKEFQDLWYEVTGDYRGRDKLNAFRREFEKRQREAAAE